MKAYDPWNLTVDFIDEYYYFFDDFLELEKPSADLWKLKNSAKESSDICR